jgi:hypothetical protein
MNRAGTHYEADRRCWAVLIRDGQAHFCFNTPMAAPRREVKLPYREMHVGCPHCRENLICMYRNSCGDAATVFA